MTCHKWENNVNNDKNKNRFILNYRSLKTLGPHIQITEDGEKKLWEPKILVSGKSIC